MKPLNWAPLTPYAIQKGNAWFSGRVMDVLLNGKVIIVGTSHGGVWTVDSSRTVLEGYDTRCLTDDWDDPNVYCLAHGPDKDQQIYAGCETTLRYFELNSANLVTTSVLLNLPVPKPSIVYRILIQKNPRTIIVAGGAGLWWSIIPTNPADATAYHWTKASGLPEATTTSASGASLPGPVIAGLCQGSNHTIHAAIFGDSSATGDNYGIFKGVFQSDNFSFTRSKINWKDKDIHGNPIPKRDMVRVSLASCATDRSAAFAAVSKSEREFRGVLQYDEAQDLWEDILDQKDFNVAKRPKPGKQGEFNNTIAVAPDDPNLVALGWQKGTFVFNPSHIFVQPENNWNVTTLSNDEDKSIRGDVHGLHFTKSESGERELYIGSDGGLLKVSDPRGKHHAFDRLNVFLPTLLFKDELRAKQYATIDVSPFTDGLIAGGLQDNGCKWLKTVKGKYTAWHQLLGGDGGTNTFLANGILISRESNQGNKFKSHLWHGNKFDNRNKSDKGSDIPLDFEVELDPKMEICTRINTPAFRSKDNHLMHAISAAVQVTDGVLTPYGKNLLLGLFEDADGSQHFHWEIIGRMLHLITAAASGDGNSVLVATDDGKISLLIPEKFLDGHHSPTDLPLPAPLQSVEGKPVMGTVVQFEITRGPVFALFKDHRTKKGHILVRDGNGWKEISTPVAEPIFSIAADWDVKSTVLTPEDKRLFFSTDNAVYQGVQSTGPQLPGFQTSFIWQKSTDGLPARPHCTHLRLGWDEKKLFLYLSTYGRSVHRAQLREVVRLPGQ